MSPKRQSIDCTLSQQIAVIRAEEERGPLNHLVNIVF